MACSVFSQAEVEAVQVLTELLFTPAVGLLDGFKPSTEIKLTWDKWPLALVLKGLRDSRCWSASAEVLIVGIDVKVHSRGLFACFILFH